MFEGRRAVVTGGLGGIGSAVSAALRQAGVEVVATGFSQAEVDARREAPELAGVEMVPLDVGDDFAVTFAMIALET